MTTYHDTKGYRIHGTRGDWSLSVTDEHGESEYITHFSNKAFAIGCGVEFTRRVNLGESLINIPAHEVINMVAM